MKRSTYHIAQMDCSAEEQMVRMALEPVPEVEGLNVDLSTRMLAVYHAGHAAAITEVLDGLQLGARLEATSEVASSEVVSTTDERTPLIWAFIINATLFVGELIAGLLSGSMGLVADALDMLADAVVYALSLAAVGGTVARKKRLAGWSGYLQMGLALLGLIEVIRRFVVGEGVPDVPTMIVVAALALLGNIATLVILSRAKRGEAHVEASWIFTSNDIKVNALVIVSAGLVWAFSSDVPDLIAGAFIFLIVASGARRILALAKS